MQTNNLVQYFISEVSESATELINNNIDLLEINESYIVKAKECSVGARNRRATITRAEKTKARSTRRDLSGFEYIDAAIKVSRGGKHTVGRDNRNKTIKNKQKETAIDNVAAINGHIRAFNQNINKIYKNIRGIITRQATRNKPEKATTISAISAIIKTIINKIIQISNNGEFDADGNDNADSDDK